MDSGKLDPALPSTASVPSLVLDQCMQCTCPHELYCVPTSGARALLTHWSRKQCTCLEYWVVSLRAICSDNCFLRLDMRHTAKRFDCVCGAGRHWAPRAQALLAARGLVQLEHHVMLSGPSNNGDSRIVCHLQHLACHQGVTLTQRPFPWRSAVHPLLRHRSTKPDGTKAPAVLQPYAERTLH
eukprot:2997354-Amphidinium_carterae.1